MESKATKVHPVGGIFKGDAGQFCQLMHYTCESGKEFDHTLKSKRKKDLPRYVENEKSAVNVGALSIIYDDITGEFGGTHTRYSLGASGLEPSPQDA